MTDERKAKLKNLRAKLANLSQEQRKAFQDRGIVATVDGRQLSLTNTMLCYLQCQNPTVVGGYQQWRRAGKQVTKGARGFSIWFPMGKKNEEGDTDEVEHFFLATVFDISQTEILDPAKVHERIAYPTQTVRAN